MSTLPGLPMFGHGQIEGFTEKYGMEYRWPRYQEDANPALVARHERQLAPLLHNRTLFAESSNFLLYDFFREDGTVDENVFAYSNRRGDERALVIYHNKFAHTRGTVDFSAAYADKGAGQLRQRKLSEGLGLSGDPAAIFAWRDSLTGLEYLRRGSALTHHGLTVELQAYQCHVFLNWRELHATAEKPWDRLCDQLNGRGVANLEEALLDLNLRPVHDALRSLLEPAMVRALSELGGRAPSGPEKIKQLEFQREDFQQNAWRRSREFMRTAQQFYRSLPVQPEFADYKNPAYFDQRFNQQTGVLMRLPALEHLFAEPWPAAARSVLPSYSPQRMATALWGPVLAWNVLELLAESCSRKAPEHAALDLFDRLRLREPLGHAFQALGFPAEESWRVAARIKVALLVASGVLAAPGAAEAELPIHATSFWLDPDVRWLTGAHEAEGKSYFIKESYEELLWWLQLPAMCTLAKTPQPERARAEAIGALVDQAAAAAAEAGYSVEAMMAVASAPEAAETALETEPAAAAEPAQANDVAPEDQAQEKTEEP
jgi:hypothetical protein